jgi:dCTP deaminase
MQDSKDSKRIFVVPAPERKDIKDASLDLKLGNYFIVTRNARFSALEAEKDTTPKLVASYQEKVLAPFGEPIYLHPGTFMLGVTWQYIGMPYDLDGQVLARSTWGRAGLTVATAIAVHPGFFGCLTLELVNHGNVAIALYPGSRIAQMVFMTIEGPEEIPEIKPSQYFGMTEPAFTKLHDESHELKRSFQT